jgi:hypothetical protein
MATYGYGYRGVASGAIGGNRGGFGWGWRSDSGSGGGGADSSDDDPYDDGFELPPDPRSLKEKFAAWAGEDISPELGRIAAARKAFETSRDAAERAPPLQCIPRHC